MFIVGFLMSQIDTDEDRAVLLCSHGITTVGLLNLVSEGKEPSIRPNVKFRRKVMNNVLYPNISCVQIKKHVRAF